MQSEEMLPLVTEDGRVTGCAARSRCHSGEKLLHPVVHLHVFDHVGKLLLQKRSLLKKIQPGKWDTAVGGHVSYGEAIAEALQREAAEEIGLKDFVAQEVDCYVFESEVERELIHVFRYEARTKFQPSTTEPDIDGFGWFSPTQIESMIERGEVTPNFASEYKRFFK
ncbi:MAG: NUDIX domain-containing protein [Firmicutes bacterium]|nr:NUDIX domain-containing protein [Bacillota bacterium]MCM1402004.1 NUDIX domain-containing protein [Bacteroides sp.]MCM1476891.1 NUDIX domain-containing protein [Bacteroides sp.]